jgi:hypothetical protein
MRSHEISAATAGPSGHLQPPHLRFLTPPSSLSATSCVAAGMAAHTSTTSAPWICHWLMDIVQWGMRTRGYEIGTDGRVERSRDRRGKGGSGRRKECCLWPLLCLWLCCFIVENASIRILSACVRICPHLSAFFADLCGLSALSPH